MNEKAEPATPKELEEAPRGHCSPSSIERPERQIWRPEKPEDLPGQDLRTADLKGCPWLLPEHLAGSDLTGNRTLPDEIAKFSALGQVAAISSEARKIFIGLIAACVYSWLVIGTTTDVALILNTASSPLPIINTPIPIAGFYIVGAGLLAAVYCYLHFYLHRLWRVLATLPAVFPDGVALDDKSDPWPLTNLVRVYFERLKPHRHPLKRLETSLSIALAWVLVPFTLSALWARYLPSHGWRGTYWLVILTWLTTVFGWRFFRFARAALSGEAPPSNGPGLRGTWRELRALSWAGRTFWFLVVVTPLILAGCSYAAFHVNPRDDRSWVAKGLIGLRLLGIRTYADLREVNVAEPPDGWNGKDWSKVKQVDLRGRNLAFVDAGSAFLANADLRGADLTGAVLVGAELQGAIFYDEDRDRPAQLRGAILAYAQLQKADLRGAELQGAFLRVTRLQEAVLTDAQLQGTYLGGAQLQGASLRGAQLQGATVIDAWLDEANLEGAQLQGADLSGARLPGSNLKDAQLQGADLTHAELQGANLTAAQLQGADLSLADFTGAILEGAQLQGTSLVGARVQGADLRGAALWRAELGSDANFRYAYWDLVDLRRMHVVPIENIEAYIAEAVASIPSGEKRKVAFERLTFGLKTAARPSRPNFSEQWRSTPNVLFEPGDPAREPFDWGPSKWTSVRSDTNAALTTGEWPTLEDYEEALAAYLGTLACGRHDDLLSQARAQWVARRLINDAHRLYARSLAARLIGHDCRSAQALPEATRRSLAVIAR